MNNPLWAIVVLLLLIAAGGWYYLDKEHKAAMSRAQDCFDKTVVQWRTVGQSPNPDRRANEIAGEQTRCYTNEGLESPNWYPAHN